MEAEELKEMAAMARAASEVADRIAAKHGEEVREFVRNLALHSGLVESMRLPRNDWRHQNYQDLLLELGVPRKAPLELPVWCEPMEAKQCFHNAFELATNDPSLTYVEGYALGTVMPVPHAWVEDESGRIIDPTWAGLITDTDEAYYLGVKFDTEFLLHHALDVGWISFFESDWTRDAEILQLGFVMDGDIAIGMGEK